MNAGLFMRILGLGAILALGCVIFLLSHRGARPGSLPSEGGRARAESDATHEEVTVGSEIEQAGDASTSNARTEGTKKPKQDAEGRKSESPPRLGGIRPPFAPSTFREGYARVHGNVQPWRSRMQLLRARVLETPGESRRVVITSQPKESGEYEIFVPPGRCKIRYGPWVCTPMLAPGEERRIDFGSELWGRVRVVIDGSAPRLGLGQVMLQTSSVAGEVTVHWKEPARLSSDGVHLFERVPVGACAATVRMPTGTPGDAMVLRGGTTVREKGIAEIRLAPAATQVTLVVLSAESGGPCPGARATVVTADGGRRLAYADASGMAEFTGLSKGMQEVLVEFEGHAPAVVKLEVEEGGREPRVIELSGGVSFPVLVTDTGGRALETVVHVMGELNGRKFQRRILTDAAGQGVISNWPPSVGTADFHARLARKRVGISVNHGSKTPVPVRFERQ